MQRAETPGSGSLSELGTQERGYGQLLWKPLPQLASLHWVTPIKTGGVRGKETKGEKQGGGERSENG